MMYICEKVSYMYKLRFSQIFKDEQIFALDEGKHLMECTVVSNEPYDEVYYRSGDYYEDDETYIEHVHKMVVKTKNNKEYERIYDDFYNDLGHALFEETCAPRNETITVYANKQDAVEYCIAFWSEMVKTDEEQVAKLNTQIAAGKEYLEEIKQKYK